MINVIRKVLMQKKKGMTLSELIIAISIFSMVMVGVNQLFISSWRNYKLVMNTSEVNLKANRGMSNVVNVLRRVTDGADGSYAVLDAGSFDLKVFSDVDKDNKIERVHYYIEGEELKMGTTEASGFPLVYPNADSESVTIVSGITNGSTRPIFSYYNNQNNQIASPVGNLIDVRMIKISFWIKRAEGDVNIESYVSLRNLSENDTID